MNRHFVSSALAFAFLGILLASCDAGPDITDDCTVDSDCGQPEACSTHRCEQHTCVEENAPAGALANSSFTPPPCHRFVCDGDGGQTLEVDIHATPTESTAACHRLDCDAKGDVISVVDTTVAPQDQPGDCNRARCDASGGVVLEPNMTDEPEDYPGDCKRTSCDANGGVIFVPNPADEPQDEPGDCMKSTCDASGNETQVPADDPPTAICQVYTCKNGQAVGTPTNQGESCAPHGLVCGASGQCDACPMLDAACTDPGPAASSHSLAQAYNLGDIGWCDGNGYPLCGTLKTGVVSYFRYIGDGSGSFCQFDPYVRVQASAPVKLCEYFDCPSVECPSGATAATLDGSPGCCVEGANPSMAIHPPCIDSEVHITVESKAPSCVGYLLDFHT